MKKIKLTIDFNPSFFFTLKYQYHKNLQHSPKLPI